MLSLITDKMYVVFTWLLLFVVLGLGLKVTVMNGTIESLEADKAELTRDMQVQAGSLALATANEALLHMSINTQNERIVGMQIDLDKAKKQYRVEEKRIYETIYSERLVLKDLNASEDCNNTKRIADEIIDLF